ncbi:hypothetical protein N658DRAFT_113373 [Parathielavia hyrcaniae]|uniref:Uncharacterized protein n=1 Tax=Parathielavia hyrcaniae TaxID=113614 RepID=A0AAN6QBJ1_9PEZI|nr:hypothetical protein N658DRAFT_113373 [Parathielavia hyrcaniae]
MLAECTSLGAIKGKDNYQTLPNQPPAPPPPCRHCLATAKTNQLLHRMRTMTFLPVLVCGEEEAEMCPVECAVTTPRKPPRGNEGGNRGVLDKMAKWKAEGRGQITVWRVSGPGSAYNSQGWIPSGDRRIDMTSHLRVQPPLNHPDTCSPSFSLFSTPCLHFFYWFHPLPPLPSRTNKHRVDEAVLQPPS